MFCVCCRLLDFLLVCLPFLGKERLLEEKKECQRLLEERWERWER